jgi:hypothetical protein
LHAVPPNKAAPAKPIRLKIAIVVSPLSFHGDSDLSPLFP